MRLHSIKNNQIGLGMVEMIVVIAIIFTVLVGTLQLIALERRIHIFAQEEVAAYILAREALEAVRSERDDDWTNISALIPATRYYPTLSAGEWSLDTVNPGPIGVFTQWVEFDEVLRDANDDISGSGVLDTDSKRVTAFISWTRAGGSARTVQLETYLTNWQAYQ